MLPAPPRQVERYAAYVQPQHILGYLKALKIVIAADGTVSEKELQALRLGMRYMGVPESVREEIEAFDPQEAKLLQVLPSFRLGCLEARYLLRDAIELAGSDGIYSQAERNAVARIAAILGIGSEVVRSLESLIELERATKRLKRALLPRSLPSLLG